MGGDVGDESRVDQLQLVFKLLQPFVCVGREHVDAALVLPRRPLHKLHATTLQEFVQVGRTAHYADRSNGGERRRQDLEAASIVCITR